MSKISKVPTVTRMAGALFTIILAVTVSGRNCQKISKVPTVTGMVGVLITILVTVTIFDVANPESANAHKDGGCPDHDP